MKIAILFGDNDFYFTFTGVLQTLLNATKVGHTALPMEKDKLAIIINELSLGIYLSHQNQFRYKGSDSMEDHIEHIRKYLKIEAKDILVGDEVQKYLMETEWNNGDTFVLDTDLDFNNNNPIYSR